MMMMMMFRSFPRQRGSMSLHRRCWKTRNVTRAFCSNAIIFRWRTVSPKESFECFTVAPLSSLSILSFRAANQKKKKKNIEYKDWKKEGQRSKPRMENEETACEHSIIQLANRKSMRASLTHLRINP